MRKIFALLLFLFFGGLTALVGYKLLPQATNFSALQVVTNGAEADVYLNNQKIGKTPFENEKMHPGEYVLKLVPAGKKLPSWSGKVILTTSAMTTVERYFSEEEKRNGGLTVYLTAIDDKMAQVEIITNPDSAKVYFNKEDKGETPVAIRDVPYGTQEIIVKKDGYEDRIHKVDTISGYKLTMLIDLITEKKPEIKQDLKTLGATAPAKVATPSGAISVTPIPTVKNVNNMIEILETGTGWLRVREEPSIAATESAKVNVKDQFLILDEQNGWIKIEYLTGKFGWVSSDYVKKL